jgi:hypothetical protein
MFFSKLQEIATKNVIGLNMAPSVNSLPNYLKLNLFCFKFWIKKYYSKFNIKFRKSSPYKSYGSEYVF